MARFLKEEGVLLTDLIEVDRHGVFEKLGYPSLFQYTTQRLKLSESIAYAFIGVARKSRQVPKLKEAVTEGKISVSQAKRIVSVVEPSNAEMWIENAATHRQRDLERLVAKELPAPMPVSRVRPVGGDYSEMTLTIPETLRKKIQRLQEVRSCSLLEAITFAVTDTLKRHDPVKKAQRQIAKALAKEGRRNVSMGSVSNAERNVGNDRAGKLGSRQLSSRTVQGEQSNGVARPGRQHTPAAEVHKVMHRDQGQCTQFYTDGTRCTNRYWTHLHHKIPVHQGGPNTADNLTTLCAQHHRMHHGENARYHRVRHAASMVSK